MKQGIDARCVGRFTPGTASFAFSETLTAPTVGRDPNLEIA